MIENEYKVMLDINQYNRILDWLEKKYSERLKRFIQINYYYDTPDWDLNRFGITLRVRHKEDSLSVELKRKIESDRHLNISRELSGKIDKLPLVLKADQLPWRDIPGGYDEFALQGSLVTERISCTIKNGLRIDLDKNFYLGIVDYEIEIEYESDLEKEASDLAALFTKGNYIRPRGGKRKRLFAALSQLRSQLQGTGN